MPSSRSEFQGLGKRQSVRPSVLGPRVATCLRSPISKGVHEHLYQTKDHACQTLGSGFDRKRPDLATPVFVGRSGEGCPPPTSVEIARGKFEARAALMQY